MRKIIGGVVLAAGVGGLGWYASANNADRMQAQITDGAAEVAASSSLGIQTDVSGRDIAASGRVQDQAEYDTLLAALNDVEGRRTVDMSAITILPIADPFAMTATRTADADTTVSGVIGSDAGREMIASQVGDLAGGLVLSSGRPDDNWAGVGASGLEGLALLKSGEMTLTGQVLTLTGLAASPVDRDAALAAIGDLPQGYTLSADIGVEDDGTPLRLTLTRGDGTVSGDGKVPATLGNVADAFADAGTIDLVQAGPAMDDTDWDGFAQNGMAALNELDAGVLTISDKTLTLTGTATPDGIEIAETLLSNLPSGYAATTDLTFTDDGQPFSLSMEYNGATVTADGKYPADYTPSAPNTAALSDTGRNSFFPEDTAFSANADAGIAALGLLENGMLDVTADAVTLSGVAATPDIAAAVSDALQGLPDGVAGATDLTLLDDGSPAAWSVAYTADGGADVSGKLPRNLSGEIIASSMGLDDVQGDPFVALTGEDAPDEALSALSIASEYLPETETLSYTTSADGVTLDMALSPGVDIDLVAADLAARLDGDVSFSIAALDELPEPGAIRTNRATMKRERFQFGNWLPILSFAPVGPICLDQSTAALENNAVNFISGSAQLDGKSIRAINALSAIAQRCVDEGGLSLEVGGHTDNTGSEISNQLLSENRAESVRNAMIARGVDADKITAVGYGQATPVADNDTIEGRAENRRTEITWSQ